MANKKGGKLIEAKIIPDRHLKKVNEYWTFVVWMSMNYYHGMNEEALIDAFGKDNDLIKLMSLKTQKDFAKEFGIAEPTLTGWKALDRFESDIFKLRRKRINQQIIPSMEESFFKTSLKNGVTAQDIKMMYDLWGSKVSLDMGENRDDEATSEEIRIRDAVRDVNIGELVIQSVIKKTGYSRDFIQGKMKDIHGMHEVADADVIGGESKLDINKTMESSKLVNDNESIKRKKEVLEKLLKRKKKD
jgi:hypothetical protein